RQRPLPGLKFSPRRGRYRHGEVTFPVCSEVEISARRRPRNLPHDAAGDDKLAAPALRRRVVGIDQAARPPESRLLLSGKALRPTEAAVKPRGQTRKPVPDAVAPPDQHLLQRAVICTEEQAEPLTIAIDGRARRKEGRIIEAKGRRTVKR